MERYGIISDKNKREIVLLRGLGCRWKKCAFCDYHLDSSDNAEENFNINRAALSLVDGRYGRLEVINSGSFAELDEMTVGEIRRICIEKNIKFLHFESHWLYRNRLAAFAKIFDGVEVKFKIGVETFDVEMRENVMKKGMGNVTAREIADAGFSEINLLFGVAGQSAQSMKSDIETGLTYFERVCVNLMTANSVAAPSPQVTKTFMREIYPLYRDNARVDILLNNTDFGVGEL